MRNELGCVAVVVVALGFGMGCGRVMADGGDALVLDQSAVFYSDSRLEEMLRIRRSLNMSGDTPALVEVVSGEEDLPGLTLLSLSKQTTAAGSDWRFWLEWREADGRETLPPKTWKLEIEAGLAKTIHEVFTQLIREARIPQGDKASLGVSQWFRCHTEEHGYNSAMMAGFAPSDGKLVAVSWAVVFAGKWIRSGGKDI